MWCGGAVGVCGGGWGVWGRLGVCGRLGVWGRLVVGALGVCGGAWGVWGGVTISRTKTMRVLSAVTPESVSDRLGC